MAGEHTVGPSRVLEGYPTQADPTRISARRLPRSTHEASDRGPPEASTPGLGCGPVHVGLTLVGSEPTFRGRVDEVR
jgi:hypothetical protein